MATVRTLHIDRERRDLDISTKIPLLEPDATPLTVIMMRARKKAAGSAEILWWDDELDARWTKVDAEQGYSAEDDEIVVADMFFRPKDVVKVPRTGEVMFVTRVDPDEKIITVIRGYGVTTADALEDGDWLLMIGNALEEASDVPAERPSQPAKRKNYCQPGSLAA